jgi:hypothetical protein
MEVICSYCGIPTRLVQGSEIYKTEDKPYSEKYFYYCNKCDAYVGCHPGTQNPLGTVANKRLRRLRKLCHGSFDKIWKNKYLSRSKAYKWLASKLDILPSQCHIGMFDEQMCLKAIEKCNQYLSNITNISKE